MMTEGGEMAGGVRTRGRRAHRILAWISALTVAAGVSLAGATPAHAASYTPIAGSGSSWSANAISQWITDVHGAGMNVSYNSIGSSAGRSEFAQKLVDFGVSEIPYQGTDPATGSRDDTSRPYAYMPIVAGGTSFMYHLNIAGKLYRDLRLSGETITKIFTGKITFWDDPQITQDNNGKKMPKKRIVPVLRSDGSGTSAQFTLWMSKQYRSLWCAFYSKCGLTSYYPKFGNAVLQSGSVQMAGYISSSTYGDGTIGYVEYSYARNLGFPVAKVRNAAGYYVLPSDFDVAVALTKARINSNRNSKDYLTQILDDVYTYTDPRVYPLSSYSYMILPTSLDGRITNEKGATLSAFAHYFLCQGQQKAGTLGYSPLPLNLVQAGFDQVARVPGHESETLDPRGCNNPTFDPSNPNSNRLAVIAPMPPSCDKVGQGPCSGGGGVSAGNGSGNGSSGNGSGSGNGTGSGPGNGSAGPSAGRPQIDPVTGEVVGTSGPQDSSGANAGSYQLAAGSSGLSSTLVVLAGAEVLLLMLVPLFMARSMNRRREGPSGTGSRARDRQPTGTDRR
jgi:phosphate transport system substrate-binding protein